MHGLAEVVAGNGEKSCQFALLFLLDLVGNSQRVVGFFQIVIFFVNQCFLLHDLGCAQCHLLFEVFLLTDQILDLGTVGRPGNTKQERSN